jgi:hypothetical protein
MILQGKSSISFNELKLSKVSRSKRGRQDGDFINDDEALAQVVLFFELRDTNVVQYIL